MNTLTRLFAPTLLAVALPLTTASAATAVPAKIERTASTITTRDGVQLYYKDWGPKDGQVVVFSHGWPLDSQLGIADAVPGRQGLPRRGA